MSKKCSVCDAPLQSEVDERDSKCWVCRRLTNSVRLFQKEMRDYFKKVEAE